MKRLLNKLLTLPFRFAFFQDAQSSIFTKEVVRLAELLNDDKPSHYDLITWLDQDNGFTLQTIYSASISMRKDLMLVRDDGITAPAPESFQS
jgi:hypothetical protein